MSAYYNEVDPYAAQWLRNLIAAGHIAPGDIDERSIVDVRPDDVRAYRQCHFFAGIGGWSLALRLAGWPDDRPVWTGSCPCQPLSGAGQRRGHADERHLWPAFHALIAECRPAVVFGEQVGSKDGREWLAAVRADLEVAGYAVGAADMPAAGVGAPHIRQRLWWVANANGNDAERRRTIGDAGDGRAGNAPRARQLVGAGGIGELADAGHRTRRKHREFQEACGIDEEKTPDKGRDGITRPAPHSRATGELGNTGNTRLQKRERNGRVQRQAMEPHERQATVGGSDTCALVNSPSEQVGLPGRAREPRSTPWSNLLWLPCSDGKARPVEPSTFPLAHGVSGRVGRLRAYGNAIVPQVAAEFIRALN